MVDATSSRTSLDRNVAIQNMKTIGAYLTTTEAVILNLLGDKNHPKFKEVQRIIKTINPHNKDIPSNL